MSYTFSTNIPQSAQKISSTQAPIQSNFQAINELIDVNHVGFTDAVNFGKHTYLYVMLSLLSMYLNYMLKKAVFVIHIFSY